MWTNTSNSSSYQDESSAQTVASSYINCYLSEPSSFIFFSLCATNIILLFPLSVFILHHGLRDCWKKDSIATIRHSDSFTYHLATMEIVSFLGNIIIIGGGFRKEKKIVLMGFYFWTFTWYGENLYHILTCVERYLAVIHPLIYLNLRYDRGIRIRNIINFCVWVFCLAGMVFSASETLILIFEFCTMTLAVMVILFCNFSVLWGLIRPSPGKQGVGREKVNKSKKRAFHTIVAILGVLMLRFTWGLTVTAIYAAGKESNCVFICLGLWLNFPGSLVLPLLFLQNVGGKRKKKQQGIQK